MAALDTHTDRDLSLGEARSRLDRYRRNELTGEKPVSARRKFLAQLPYDVPNPLRDAPEPRGVGRLLLVDDTSLPALPAR